MVKILTNILMHAKNNKNKKESVDACRWNNIGSELVTAIYFHYLCNRFRFVTPR